MSSSAQSDRADIRVLDVQVSREELSVKLMDGRRIVVPLSWYPRLAAASDEQLAHWQVAGAGYGIHWPDLDEDVSTEGLLRGQRAPLGSEGWHIGSPHSR